jgi:hypothetical protein
MRVLGNSSGAANGCPANAVPSQCLADLRAVTHAGTLHFLDGNVLKFIDANERIGIRFTLSLGIGDGQVATRARLGQLGGFAQTAERDWIVLDLDERRIRRVRASTGRIETLAGDGRVGPVNLSQDSRRQGLGEEPSFRGKTSMSVEASGAVFSVLQAASGTILAQLGSNFRWTSRVGGGSTPWALGDGLLGSSISLGSDNVRVLGADFGSLLVTIHRADRSAGRMVGYSYTSDSVQTGHIGSGSVSATETGFSLDSDSTASTIPRLERDNYPDAIYDFNGRWMTLAADGRTIAHVDGGGRVRASEVLPHAARAFTYLGNSYAYCGVDGVVRAWSPGGTPRALTTSSAVTCVGPSIKLIENQVVFQGLRNGQYAIFRVPYQ